MSPLIRTWLAARLPDWADHGYAILRGIGYHLGITTEWDPCEIDKRYTTLLDVANHTATPALALMLGCETCGARTNAPCVNRYGEPTGPHKSRRDAATAASTLTGGAS